jgi:hypothetical protein
VTATIQSIRVTQKQYTAVYIEIKNYIVMQRKEEDSIYEDPNEAIYRVSS